jgi:hypothetical protein
VITNCCETVPHPHGSFEALAKAINTGQESLQAGLVWVINASEQNMGHLGEPSCSELRWNLPVRKNGSGAGFPYFARIS